MRRAWQEIPYLPGRLSGEEAPGHHKGWRDGFQRHDNPGGKHRLPSLLYVADEADANEANRLDMRQARAECVGDGNRLDKAHGGSLVTTDPEEKEHPAPDSLSAKLTPPLTFANHFSRGAA